MTGVGVLTSVDNAVFRTYPARTTEVGTLIKELVDVGLTARLVRGRKSRTRNSLFDEFAAALQFPLYFGENWDAFEECISDLELLPPGAGYVLVVLEPELVLLDEHQSALATLVESLHSASAIWSRPVERGEWWDRPPVPFHVVLAGDETALSAARPRWASAGATPEPLDADRR